MFQNLVKYFDFSKKISKQLAIHHHKSCYLGQDLQNELSCVASFNKKRKHVTCFHHCPPIGGHENFFRTRDLRQSISRARKPPSTKNQPIWRKKFLTNFWYHFGTGRH